MKLFIALCGILTIVAADWSPPTQEEFSKYREECMKEGKLSEDDAKKISKRDYPGSKQVNCFIRCVGLKAGTWDDGTGYDLDRVYETFNANNWEVSKKELKECLSHLGDADACTQAATITKCFLDRAKKKI